MSKSGLTLVLHISYLRAFMKDTLKNHMDADDAGDAGVQVAPKRQKVDA